MGSIVGLSVMEVGAEIELNVENQEEEFDEKKKKKRKLVRRRKKKDPDDADDDAAQLAAFEATKRQRRRSTLSLEVQKMAEGKPLTHFQAMAMLRKALVASFIKPPSGKNKAPEMKSTENRRLSAVFEMDKKMEGVNLEEKCLLLKTEVENKVESKEDKENIEEEGKENIEKEEEDKEEAVKEEPAEKSNAVKLVGQVAGKKSSWKIVEKQFIQGKDVSKNDAWKLIFLSDIFPKGSRGLQDLNAGSDNEQSASGEDYDSEDPATGSDDVSNE